MSMYTIVLHKFTCVLQLGSWQRQLGKTVVIKVGTYLVLMDRKTTVYELKVNKMFFFFFFGGGGGGGGGMHTSCP